MPEKQKSTVAPIYGETKWTIVEQVLEQDQLVCFIVALISFRS